MCIRDRFSWVQDYYALDDREQMAQKEKEAEKNFLEAIATCNEEKKTAGRQKGRGQTKKTKTEGKKKPDNKSEKTAEKPDEVQLSLFDAGLTT